MKTSEKFALNQWLTDYPIDMDYQGIIDLLCNTVWLGSDSDITPWILVENHTGDQIAQFIEDTKNAFEGVTT
jgi:hypothetical protein